MTEQMRAALYENYGGPEVLYVGRIPVPQSGPSEVLVKVEATTVNGSDPLMRAGKLRLITGNRFPRPVGIDFVGTIVTLGAAVSELRVGDRVWGTVDERGGQGAAAEYVAVAARTLGIAPTNLTSGEAVTLLAGGTTAFTGLRYKAHLQAGESLLVRGASGGVGSVAVQIGALLGAKVTALANPSSSDFLRGIGANEVIDYRTAPSQLGEYDVIFDTRCTDLPSYRRLLTPGGRMVSIAFDTDHLVRSIAYTAGSILHGRRRVRFFRGQADRHLLDQLAGFAQEGSILPVIHHSYDLEEIASAHAALQDGGVHGKLVIQI